jgi:hypothetical protein
MGTVTPIAEARAKRQQAPEAVRKALDFTRTPALAFIMAMLEPMARKDRGLILARVMGMAERCTDCEATQEAGRIAAYLTFAMQEDR